MLEAIFEFLLEIIGQVVVKLLIDLGVRGIANLLRNRVVRAVLGLAAAAGVGFGGGYWWGARWSWAWSRRCGSR